MSKTGNGRRASTQPRDTPITPDVPFDIVLQLQCEHYHMDGLLRALSFVVTELSKAPDTSRHPAVAAAEALRDAMLDAQGKQLATLENLERNRFSKGRVACN